MTTKETPQISLAEDTVQIHAVLAVATAAGRCSLEKPERPLTMEDLPKRLRKQLGDAIVDAVERKRGEDGSS